MKSTFKVLFYLKKDKISKDGKVPVMGRITVNGTQAGFSCKLNIAPALWDEKTNYLKSQRNTLRAKFTRPLKTSRLKSLNIISRSATVMRMLRPIRSRMLTTVSATDIKRLLQLSITTWTPSKHESVTTERSVLTIN